MRNDSGTKLDAVIWLILPESAVENDESRKSWLDNQAGPWIEIVLKNSVSFENVLIVVYNDGNIIADSHLQEKIRHTLREEYENVQVGFEETNCLEIAHPEDGFCCDLLSEHRCFKARRLLLIDPEGNGHTCFGYWTAHRKDNEKSPLIDPDIMKGVYQMDADTRFISLCSECLYAKHEENGHVFPCSRSGLTGHEYIIQNDRFKHLRFGMQSPDQFCKHYVPIFEISLENSRQRLEEILFHDNFWKEALIDRNKNLEMFWPDNLKYEEKSTPILGEDPYTLDFKVAFSSFPPSNSYAMNIKECTPETQEKIKQAFLPVCFLPHLRILFHLSQPLCLLSVILTDPHRGSELRYRSLYRESVGEIPCFKDKTWEKIWRLPYRWDTWKDLTLNLSSAVRDKRMNKPVEYIALLGTHKVVCNPQTKRLLDFTSLKEEFSTKIKDRARILNNLAKECDERHFELGKAFFDPEDPENQGLGKQIWDMVSKEDWAQWLWADVIENGWTGWKNIEGVEQARNGCRLLNYLIWIQSIFDDTVKAIESFSAWSNILKSPSQFVAFSTEMLDTVARARLKLTLSTLMSPIENAYEISQETEHAQHATREILLRIIRHGFGNWLTGIIYNFRKIDEWRRENNPEDKSLLGYTQKALQYGGVGSLHLKALEAYGIIERDIPVSYIEKTLELSGLDRILKVQFDPDSRDIVLPGRVLFAVAELLANAFKSIRNEEILDPVEFEANRIGDEMKFVVKNRCIAPANDWLKEGIVATHDDFGNGHGLKLCSTILRMENGSIQITYSDQIVHSEITIPIK